MKLKKGKLLQRMMAVLLSVLLTAELLQGAAPITVLAQGTDIASGTDWVLDADGHLTISSNAGMSDWKYGGKSQYNSQVVTAEILDGVTDISEAFWGYNSSVTSVTLPSGLEIIGRDAFRECASLRSIIIPDDVRRIEGYAFYQCSSLETVTISESANTESIGDFAFYQCGSLKSITIPNSVTSIGTNSFANCGLESVDIPDNVTEIKASAFSGCSDLSNIKLPDAASIAIGRYAFSNCISLGEIIIPSGVTTIDQGMAQGCTSLVKVSIPSSVTGINKWAFKDCGSLTDVTMEASTPPTIESDSEIFQNCGFVTNNVKGIKVPSGSADAYKAAWTAWADYIEAESGSSDIVSGTDWTLDSNGKLTITSDAGMEDWVLSKGTNDRSKQVVSVEIQDGVTYIKGGSSEESAFFECSNLTSITISNTVTDIQDRAFYGCSKLTEIELPANLTTMGNFAFCLSGLENIVIPEKVQGIGRGAFNLCNSLENIKFASNDTIIGEGAFMDCGSLTGIELPANLTTIEAILFYGCSSLTSITIPSGVTAIGNYAFLDCSSLENVTLQGSTPPELRVSGSRTNHFGGCKFVTDNTKGIKVPEGTADAYKTAWTEWVDYITDGSEPEVTIIASGTDWTLDSNGKLTITSDAGMEDWVLSKGTNDRSKQVVSVEIQDGVTYIKGGSSEESAFFECSNLTSITISNTVTDIQDRAFYECSKLTEIELPANLTTLGNYAFGLSGLENIVIPEKVQGIGRAAFNLCESLENIKFASNDTTIGEGAFMGCGSLIEIELPANLTTIEAVLFSGCSSLTSITIPSGVTTIGYNAFLNCSSLENVILQRSTPPGLIVSGSTTGHFGGCKFVTDNTKGIKVPGGTADAYKTVWTEWADYITDGSESEVTIIASGTDWTLDSNGKLTISSDAGMEDWSLVRNPLQSVISVEIKDGVTVIAERAFEFCSNLISVTIPSSVTDIKDYAFYECSKLTDLELPAGLTSIGRFAFSGCNSLTSVKIPASVQKMEYAAFSECSSLENITILSTATAIGEYAFLRCSSLKGIKLPADLTAIETGVFSTCSSLTSITIPSGVTSIGPNAFRKCESLESVTMQGSTPPTLTAFESGKTAHFEDCKFVTEGKQGIKVPAGTVDAYKAAWTEWADYIEESSAPDTPTDKDKVDAAKKAVEAALADITVSNSTTAESLAAAVKEALKKAGTDGDITVTVEDFVRTNATADAAGSISANIKIASGTESVSVPVNKSINKLPGTPADKVAAVKAAVEDAVKKAVETALGETKVTNENAEEVAAQITALLPNVIAKALEDAGVSDTEIGIGDVDIKIEPATADSEGSIKITIPVTSKEDAGQSANAEVRITIAKPGEASDPDKDAQEAQKTVEDALKDLTITNETTPEDILAALKEAFGDKATVDGIEEFVKEDATEDAPGSLKLKIKLTINGNTIFITVNVPIAQLIRRTGVYVRFMDYYDMVDSTPRYKYTGMAIKPAVEVYNDQTLLIPGKDYTLGYKNNTKVGSTAALTVKGKGNFSGTSNVINFTIINADINEDTEHPTEMTVTVNTKVAPIIMNGTKKLTTKDYKLEGTGLVNGKYAAATAAGAPNTLTVKGIGSYEGSSFEIKVTVIEKSAAKKLAVTVDKNFKPVYDGQALDFSTLIKSADNGAGAITVTDSKDKTKLLKEGTDFTVVCTSSLSNAGTVKFTVTGMGEYTGSVNKTFKIAPLKVTDSSKFSVTFDENKAYEYKADGATVDNLVVRYLGATDTNADDKILTQGVDYKVTYSNNKKVSGTKDAGFKITFLGNYKGSSAISKTFKVVTAKLSSANTVVTVPDKVYKKANQAYKSTPIVTVDGVTIKASNYTVAYAWATESQAGDDTKYVSDNKVKITIADGDTYAKVKVTITMKETGSYGPAEGAVIAGEYYVRKAGEAIDLSKAKVTFFNKAGAQLKTLEYNGKTFYTPAGNNPEANNAPADPNAVYVKVTLKDTVVDPSLYDVTWTNARAKGKATVVIRGKGISSAKGAAVGSKNQAVNIKAMVLKGKTLDSYIWNVAGNLKNLLFNK